MLKAIFQQPPRLREKNSLRNFTVWCICSTIL